MSPVNYWVILLNTLLWQGLPALILFLVCLACASPVLYLVVKKAVTAALRDSAGKPGSPDKPKAPKAD